MTDQATESIIGQAGAIGAVLVIVLIAFGWLLTWLARKWNKEIDLIRSDKKEADEERRLERERSEEAIRRSYAEATEDRNIYAASMRELLQLMTEQRKSEHAEHTAMDAKQDAIIEHLKAIRDGHSVSGKTAAGRETC